MAQVLFCRSLPVSQVVSLPVSTIDWFLKGSPCPGGPPRSLRLLAGGGSLSFFKRLDCWKVFLGMPYLTQPTVNLETFLVVTYFAGKIKLKLSYFMARNG